MLPRQPFVVGCPIYTLSKIQLYKSIIAFLKMNEHIGIKTEKAQKQDWDGTLATKLY